MYQKLRLKSVEIMGALPFGVGDFLMQSEFSRNILKLSSASVVAGLTNALIQPINSRLFSPEDYGNANLIMNLIGILSCFLFFNLTPVIVMEKRERVAEATATLCLILLPISILISGVLFYCFQDDILNLINASDAVLPYIWLIYLGLFLAGFSTLLGNFIVRRKLFGTSSKIGIATNFVRHGITLWWGILNSCFIAFYLPNVITQILNIALIFKYSSFSLVWNLKRLLCIFWKNLSFMFFQTTNAILGIVGSMLPPLWIYANCGPADAGFFAMATTLVDVPCNLLLGSFQPIYYKRVAETVANEPHMLMNLYWRNTIKLTLLGIIPLGCIALASPFIPYILGDKWEAVIPILQLFLIWRAMRFFNAPSYAVLTVLRKNYVFVLLSIIQLILNILVLSFFSGSVVQIIIWLIIALIPYGIVLLFATNYHIRKFSK